ncbi:MAG: hypothetical protein BWY20_02101 [Spirochaetes bacterium ADurb.Bin215]|nr:MAG: hypothetical protein BWY20_02101 [Spirochaetes bacterium ADurb.Bin215]
MPIRKIGTTTSFACRKRCPTKKETLSFQWTSTKRMENPIKYEITVASAIPATPSSGKIQKPVRSIQLRGMLMMSVTMDAAMFQCVSVFDARIDPYDVRSPTKMKLKAITERYEAAQAFCDSVMPSTSPARPEKA